MAYRAEASLSGTVSPGVGSLLCNCAESASGLELVGSVAEEIRVSVEDMCGEELAICVRLYSASAIAI